MVRTITTYDISKIIHFLHNKACYESGIPWTSFLFCVWHKQKKVAAMEFLTISPSTLRPFSQNIEWTYVWNKQTNLTAILHLPNLLFFTCSEFGLHLRLLRRCITRCCNKKNRGFPTVLHLFPIHTLLSSSNWISATQARYLLRNSHVYSFCAMDQFCAAFYT